MFRRFFLLSLFLAFAGSCWAADSSCSSDLPVDIVGRAGGVVRDLKPADLVALAGKNQDLKIESLTYDAGPRRILFVLDTVHDLPSDARKAEAKIVERILASARPNDSFALITSRGTSRSAKFDQGLDALKQVVAELATDPKDKASAPGVLDAVMEGISWFGDPKPGDSVFLMAMNLENNHKTNVKKVAHELETRHMRLFGLVLGPINLGNTAKTQTDNYGGKFSYAQASDLPDYRDQEFYPLVMNSGGFLYGDDALNEQREYKLTDDRLQRLQTMGLQFYQVMTEFYHLNVQLNSHTPWKLGISPGAQERITGNTVVLYPRQIECGK